METHIHFYGLGATFVTFWSWRFQRTDSPFWRRSLLFSQIPSSKGFCIHYFVTRFVVRCYGRKVVRMRIVARMSAGDVSGGFDLEEPGKKSVGNSKSVLTLVLFFLSNFAVIFPLRIPILHVCTELVVRALRAMKIAPPSTAPIKKRFIWLNFLTVPLISVLILLATKSINGEIVRRGILGADGVEPINILALFISLAYIAISLDFTGLLRFSAFWVAHKGGSSGRRLYFYLYAFFLICGVVVGNDPVILSGTAFLAYFTRVAGITPPTAWIFSQFAAANMASVVLVSSNPTNLVLSGAFSIPFIQYTAHVILPFLAAALLTYPILTISFFRSPILVPQTLEFDPSEAGDRHASLVDKPGAIFGSVLLLVTLAVLVGTSTVGVPVWEITVPAAVVMLVRDIVHDWTQGRALRREQEAASRQESIQLETFQGRATSMKDSDNGNTESSVPKLSTDCEPNQTHPTEHPKSPPFDLLSFTKHRLHILSSRFPTVATILKRLPISLLPFAFLMFVLVQGLSAQGWVQVFAAWWKAWVDKTGTLGAIGGMGFISCVLCNICGTNIGATILLARVLQLWIQESSFSSSELTTAQPTPTLLDPKTRDGAIYALAIGSNYGAFTLTFSASLAGLLWRQILQQKGIRVRGKQFLMLNFPIAFVAMTASCSVLVAQVYVVHR